MKGLLLIALSLAVLTACSFACADPMRVLIAASHRDGLPGEQQLRHAERDVLRVRDVFVRLGGVKPEHAMVLAQPTGARLMAAIDQAAALAEARAPGDVTLVFYFSGHGDRDAIHLGSELVSVESLEARVRMVPSALRIIVIDACRTNDGRRKGFADAEPFAIQLPDVTSARGTVRLRAAAEGEAAQESDQLEGAVFTYYWVNGLSGAADADGDSRVTLGESYNYAYQQTLWHSARGSGVAQRPSAAIELDEAAPLVLTHVNQTSALRLPRGADTHYVVYGVGSQTVVGDLWSSVDRNVVLALSPGRYIVHRSGAGWSGAAQLTVGHGEQFELRAGDFRPVPEDVLSRKGGEISLWPNELGVAYSLRTTPRLMDVGHELDLRYGHAWDRWAVDAEAHGGTGALAVPLQQATLRWVGVAALLEHRIPLGASTLACGVGVVGDYVFQTIRRTDTARLAAAGYSGEHSFAAPAAGGRFAVGLRLPIHMRAWLDARARADLVAAQFDGNLAALWGISGSAGVGLAF